MKECVECGALFVPKTSSNTCSESCRLERARRKSRERVQEYRIRDGTIKKPFSGKGGNNKTGKDHPWFTTGLGVFLKTGKQIKEENPLCNRCKKDLTNAGNFGWCAHHKDHNRLNNELSNLEILCKRCHQIEHDCWRGFLGVTAIPEEGVPTSVGKRTGA
jgi:hypothetical protein